MATDQTSPTPLPPMTGPVPDMNMPANPASGSATSGAGSAPPPAQPAPVDSAVQGGPQPYSQDGTQGSQRSQGDPSQAGQTGQQPGQAPGQQGQKSAPSTPPSTVPAGTPNAHLEEVQKAGKFHSMALALMGGQRYKTTIDVNTGLQTQQKIPVSRSDIGMAIAMEAISGALTGLAQSGPGANARGAAIAFGQAQQQRQQENKQQDDKANADFARHSQVFEANMRMRNLAMTAGRMGQEGADLLTKSGEGIIKYNQENSPENIGDTNVASTDALDMKKYPPTEWARVADNTVPVLKDGKQVYTDANNKSVPEDTPGAMARFENTYTMIHRDAKMEPVSVDGASPVFKDAVGWGLMDKSLLTAPAGTQIPGAQAAIVQHKVTTLNLADAGLKSYFDFLNTPGPGQDPKTAPRFTAVDLHEINARTPGLTTAIDKFQPLLNAAGGDVMKAVGELGKKNPAAAQKITEMYGGSDVMKAYDEKMTQKKEYDKKQADTQAAIEKEKALGPIKRQQAVAEQAALAPGNARLAGQEEAARLAAKYAADHAHDSAAQTAAASEAPVNGVRLGYLGTLPIEIAHTVQAIGEGRQVPDVLLRGAEGKKLADMVNTAYPTYSSANAKVYLKNREAYTSGPESNYIGSLNTAIGHLAIMSDNATLANFVPGVKQFAKKTGDQPVSDYQAALSVVKDELGKAYKGSALTEQDMKQFDTLLKATTPKEAKATVLSLVKLLDHKLSSYDHTLAISRPSDAVEPLEIMSPVAKEAYTHLTGTAPKADSEQQARYAASPTYNRLHTGMPDERRPMQKAGVQITQDVVDQYMTKAGGDQTKAKQMLANDGWE